jgi:hypothetical protein
MLDKNMNYISTRNLFSPAIIYLTYFEGMEGIISKNTKLYVRRQYVR